MIEAEIFTSENIQTVKWDKYTNGTSLKRIFEPWVCYGSKAFATNTNHVIHLVACNKLLLPILVANSSKIKNKSYLSSLIGQYINYTQEEIEAGDKYSRVHKLIASVFLPFIGFLLQIFGAEKVVFVNNFLLSTNLYPTISQEELKAISDLLIFHFPNDAIIFRSVNENTDEAILNDLLDLNYQKIVCRQLYMLDVNNDKKYKKKRPFVMDNKHWLKHQDDFYWEKCENLSSAEGQLVISYYSDLYLKKYSSLNPQYTEEFIELALLSKMLDFYLLRHRETKHLKAVQAVRVVDGVITTPFIGYDQSEPRELGLYRMMSAQLIELAEQNQLVLNMSSGASSFKKQRGGKPFFEYHMVYAAHLTFFSKLFWAVFNKVSEKYIKPAFLKYEV